MSDNTVRLSTIGQILRWRWRLLAVLAAAGALVGAGASLVLSPGYETSASVLLQGPREPDELLTEAQVAMSTVVLDRAAAALNWGRSGTELQDAVTAEVADGNVIAIFGTADTPERARQLADQVAQEYVTYSAQLLNNTGEASAQVLQEQQEALRQQIGQTNDRITQLHDAAQGVTVESVQVRTELEALRTSLNQAMTNLEEAQGASSRANMVVMGPAPVPESAAAPAMTHFVVGGAGLFPLLGVFGHLIAARADRRLRDESEIASALGGGAVLASLDVPAAPRTRPDGWLDRLRHLLLVDVPWQDAAVAHDDDLGRDTRYRRVLTRLLAEQHARRVLVLVARGDLPAHDAAARLAATADHDDPSGPTVQVVEVTPDRPTVPDADRRSPVDGVLVAVSAGSRTAWELVGIAEACADAGQRVLGTLVTHPVRSAVGTEPDERDEQARRDPAMAGSS